MLQFLRTLGPDEGPGILVVTSNVAQQEFFQLALGAVHALRQALLAKNAKEVFTKLTQEAWVSVYWKYTWVYRFNHRWAASFLWMLWLSSTTCNSRSRKVSTTSFMKCRKITEGSR